VRRALGVLNNGGVLASTSATAPEPDYDPVWLLLAHPASFPHGTGQCPKGVSRTKWMATLLGRNIPGFATPSLLLTEQDIQMRHAVHTQAFVQVRNTPQLQVALATANVEHARATAAILTSGARGGTLATRLREAAPEVRAMVGAVKAVSGRVDGTPSSYAGKMSRSLGIWMACGRSTMMLNLNPADGSSRLCAHIAGWEYACEGPNGAPDARRPGVGQRWRLLCANPTASSRFFAYFVRAFITVFLGWDFKQRRQVNRHCMFGRVAGFAFKWESTQRHILHTHGTIIQPDLQPERLRYLFENGGARFTAFLEAVACQFLPDGFLLPGCNERPPNVGLNAVVSSIAGLGDRQCYDCVLVQACMRPRMRVCV
jgi:hypothetical protein